MTTTEQTQQPHESIYTYAGFIGIGAGWRYQSVVVGVMATIAAAVGIYMYRNGYWTQLWEILRPMLITTYKAILAYIKSKPVEEQETKLLPLEVCIGQNIETKQYLIPNLQEIGSFLIVGQTGSGKTTSLHGILDQLLRNSTPKQLKLVIADLKEGLDFRIYKKLPHLLFPVATNVEQTLKQVNGLLAEMSRRAELYKIIPEDRLCNNLDDYHRLGSALGLPKLPWILAIIDEFQNITIESEEALNGLVKLGKEGRAFGISLGFSTQLSNVEAIPTKLKSQCTSYFCGWLSNPSHYYKIVETTKEIWEPFHSMGKIKGRFISSVGGEVNIIQSIFIAKSELEETARKWSQNSQEPTWENAIQIQTETQAKSTLQGSIEQKRAILGQWICRFSDQPTLEEFLEDFDSSRSAYYRHVVPMWKELKG